MITSIELGEANASLAINTIRTELTLRNKSATIAISDSHGELIALLKMDGAPLSSVLVAMNKAYTSARTGDESGNIGRSSAAEGWDLANFGDPRYIGWEGGVAVRINGKVAGAVAVSGLTGEEDVELARLGANAIIKNAEEIR